MKLTKMPKKSSSDDAAKRAWRLLRPFLLWTIKSGVFKRKLTMELKLVPKFLKGLGHTTTQSTPAPAQIRYKERQLSFDETPVFNVKMHRPASMRFLLPCISPEGVDFDYDFGIEDDDNHGVYGYVSKSKGNSTSSEKEEEEEQRNEKECCNEKSPCTLPLEEEGIDSKADKFIAKFYEQMRFQRQISYMEYTEMLNRGAS